MNAPSNTNVRLVKRGQARQEAVRWLAREWVHLLKRAKRVIGIARPVEIWCSPQGQNAKCVAPQGLVV